VARFMKSILYCLIFIFGNYDISQPRTIAFDALIVYIVELAFLVNSRCQCLFMYMSECQ
jgi:hypothetical protein